MDRHVRVLQARRQAGTVRGSVLGRERARDEDEHEGEERPDEREYRHRPGEQVARNAACRQDGRRRIAAEDKQPEEERSFLASPERRQRVAKRQLAARVVGDVLEREIVAREGRKKNRSGDGARGERCDQCVLGGGREATAPFPRG